MLRPGPLRLLDLTFPTAAENVALDEALLRAVEDSNAEPVLRLWELDHHAVILGRANRIERNIDLDACRRDGVPVLDIGLRRPTLDDVFLSLTGHLSETETDPAEVTR